MGVWVPSWFKRLGMTPQGPTKGPWGEPLRFDAALPSSVHRRGRLRSISSSTGPWGNRHPTLRRIHEGPCSPSYCYTWRKRTIGRHWLDGARGHRRPIRRKIGVNPRLQSLWKRRRSAGRRGVVGQPNDGQSTRSRRWGLYSTNEF